MLEKRDAHHAASEPVLNLEITPGPRSIRHMLPPGSYEEFSDNHSYFDNDKPKEKCGVVAIACKGDLSSHMYYALRALQHRGQEASGMVTFDKRQKMKKGIGLVDQVFSEADLKRLKGNMGIGHTYYSIKVSQPENAQPFTLKTDIGDIAIAHNGIIVNAPEIVKEMKSQGYQFTKSSEEEAFALILNTEMSKHKDVQKALQVVAKKLIGSYSFTLMINGRVFAMRDPLGLKPLCLGQFDGGYIVASETGALDVIGAKLIRDIQPGEAVELFHDKVDSFKLASSKRRAHCFFEWVYFARADSIIDRLSVYHARKRIGWRLAKEHPVDADVVIAIPDSGRGHAYGFSMGSGIKLSEGIMKNRYVQRTFIMPSQYLRDVSIKDKLNPVRAVVEGRRVVLVDDSIVRGTTMKTIIQILRNAGAVEVHVRIGSPPIIAPCYLGIDMTTRDQFIANHKEVKDIGEAIGADSLGYISIDGMVEALQIEYDNLCLGCVTSEYPLPISGERERDQHTLDMFD